MADRPVTTGAPSLAGRRATDRSGGGSATPRGPVTQVADALLRPPGSTVRAVQLLLAALTLLGILATGPAVQAGPGAWGGLPAVAGWLAAPVAACTALLCLLVTRAQRTGRPAWWAWLCLTAGYAALAAGELADGSPVAAARAAAGPGGPDLLAFAYYPLTGIALVILLRDRTPSWAPARTWDAAVVAGGTLACGLAAIDLADAAAGGSAAGRAGFPLADALLLAAVLGVGTVAGGRTGIRLRWLAAGLVALGLADLLLSAGADAPAGARTALPTLTYLLGFVLAGFATTRPDLAADPPASAAGPAWRIGRLTAATLAAAVGVLGLAALSGLLGRAAVLTALVTAALGLGRLLWLTLDPDPPVWAGPGLWPRGRAADPQRTDDVTGLANRRALAEALAQGTLDVPEVDPGEPPTDGDQGEAAAAAARIAVLLVDLDRFKDVNDALGHAAGDALLAAVADRMRSALRPSQLLARLGGDEFAIVLPGTDAAGAQRVAAALRQAIDDPFEIAGSRLHVRASVGVATARRPSEDTADLLRRADVAMYRAKRAGSGIEVYRPGNDRQGKDRLRRIDELRSALDRGELEVYLQPQVDLRTGDLIGAEALARWRHPVDGVLLPASFLPLAAQTGVMRPVARRVLDRSLAACSQWWRLGHQLTVSVNLTADDLADAGLPTLVEVLLAQHDLPGRALHVEITEEALLTDPARTAALLRQWRTDGVTVSVDDYGTGYSSLAYLRDLPVGEVKLDQSFASDLISGTPLQQRTLTIVKHTVAMAHGLGLRVVAEGIENQATAEVLTGLSCDVGQGLYFGDAVAPEAFLQLLPRSAL